MPYSLCHKFFEKYPIGTRGLDESGGAYKEKVSFLKCNDDKLTGDLD